MRKTLKIACMLLFAAFAMPEMAQAQANKTEVVVAGLISELQTSGYSNISERRTWLGRLRIRAERGEYIREIIINPRTGEILRDYHFELEDGLFGFEREENESQSGGEGEEDDDDDEDDGDDDDSEEGGSGDSESGDESDGGDESE